LGSLRHKWVASRSFSPLMRILAHGSYGYNEAQGMMDPVDVLRNELAIAVATTGRPIAANTDRSVIWSAPGR